jgi:hypothetical protein
VSIVDTGGLQGTIARNEGLRVQGGALVIIDLDLQTRADGQGKSTNAAAASA